MERVIVHYTGRVQGVGFRVTTVDISRQFEVVGRVRNNLDGSVRLIADGKTRDLQAFLEAIQARLGRYIVDVTADWEPLMGPSEFQKFEVAASEGC